MRKAVGETVHSRNEECNAVCASGGSSERKEKASSCRSFKLFQGFNFNPENTGETLKDLE